MQVYLYANKHSHYPHGLHFCTHRYIALQAVARLTATYCHRLNTISVMSETWLAQQRLSSSLARLEAVGQEQPARACMPVGTLFTAAGVQYRTWALPPQAILRSSLAPSAHQQACPLFFCFSAASLYVFPCSYQSEGHLHRAGCYPSSSTRL